jgi:hypothetical protein
MQQGQLQVVPFRPDRDVVIESESIGLAPWNVLTLLGIRGRAVDDGEEVVVVSLEWPRPYSAAARVEKREMEAIHVEQFCTDHLLSLGRLPYDLIESSTGARPDFIAQEGEQSFGLECAQYTVQSRRHAAALFEDVRDAVMKAPDRRRFAHLRGRFVFMWFRRADGRPELPPKARETDAVVAITEALTEEIPLAPAAEVEPAEAPPEFPGEQLGIRNVGLPGSDFECGFYSVPMRGAAPAGTFFARTGFEIGLSYQTTQTRTAAREELLRLISEHDKPEVNHLLISAGAPNRAGLTFISEAYVLDFLLSGPDLAIPAPSHIKRVLIHFWGLGRIIEVHPSLKGISTDLYAGYVPSHFLGAARAVEASDGERTSA